MKLQGKYLNSTALIKRLNLSETSDKKNLIKKKAKFFCQLIMNSYQIMADLCNDPSFPQGSYIEFINYTSNIVIF